MGHSSQSTHVGPAHDLTVICMKQIKEVRAGQGLICLLTRKKGNDFGAYEQEHAAGCSFKLKKSFANGTSSNSKSLQASL